MDKFGKHSLNTLLQRLVHSPKMQHLGRHVNDLPPEIIEKVFNTLLTAIPEEPEFRKDFTDLQAVGAIPPVKITAYLTSRFQVSLSRMTQ